MPHGEIACKATWLRQQGEMRFAPDRPWLPFTAEQWFQGDGIDFRWHARMRMAPLVSARVLDCFQNGAGILTAHILGFIPVARSRGPDTDRGEATRGLAELPWRPFAFRERSFLKWKILENGKLRVVFDNGATQATVDFEVDAKGHVLGGSAPGRARIVGKSVVETPWSGAFGEYKTFDAIDVPTSAEAIWHPPEGPFTYWRGRVLDFRVLR